MPSDHAIPFSVRNQGSHSQVDRDFPKSARVGLLHGLDELDQRELLPHWTEVWSELQRIARVAPSARGHSESTARNEFALQLQALPWEKAFDFCERLYGFLATKLPPSRAAVAKQVIELQLQALFLEESLAFEFVDGLVRRRGRRHTADQMSRAQIVLGDPALDDSRKHYDKALQFFRDPSAPDYENAVKEAVCALEAAGKALFPESGAATLGDLVKWLVASKDVRLPKTLGQTLSGVYGFRSGGQGVGHGGADGGEATAAVAEYVLAICASQIIYLVDLANQKQRSEIPF